MNVFLTSFQTESFENVSTNSEILRKLLKRVPRNSQQN